MFSRTWKQSTIAAAIGGLTVHQSRYTTGSHGTCMHVHSSLYTLVVTMYTTNRHVCCAVFQHSDRQHPSHNKSL